MRDRYTEFVRLGGEVLAVSFAHSTQIAAYLAQTPLPFPMVGDPSRAAYRAFGLERASWSAILGLRSIFGYLLLILRGWLPRRPNEGEDVLQLGGDFMLDAHGRLVYAYRSTGPTDRPSVEDLVRALGTAADDERPA